MLKDIVASVKSIFISVKIRLIKEVKNLKQSNFIKNKDHDLSFLEDQMNENLAIQFCTRWSKERQWCLREGLDISNLEEEKRFFEYIVKYNFR